MTYITWTPEKAQRLKSLYLKAVDQKLKTFTMDGHELVPRYAYYLLTHLAYQFRDPSLIPEKELL